MAPRRRTGSRARRGIRWGNISPYLCRLFARFHDETAYQYLTRLRMGHASRLLLEPDASVKSVADALGFTDAFHFSRVFKSVHQVPPSRFRRAMHPLGQDREIYFA